MTSHFEVTGPGGDSLTAPEDSSDLRYADELVTVRRCGGFRETIVSFPSRPLDLVFLWVWGWGGGNSFPHWVGIVLGSQSGGGK